MTHRRGGLAALTAFLAALVVTGCTTLPTSGSVHTRTGDSSDSVNQAPYFTPPGPAAGADPSAIVEGFLLAIQANPPSTAVARSFLVDDAKATWKPAAGTIVYDSSTLTAHGTQVQARLAGAHRLDPSGGWRGGSTSSALDLSFHLVQQHGQWRIANPPASLPVLASYFRSLYAPYTLYFYDRTGTVLVPTQIYLPRGEQVASNLVRGLLDGPGSDLGRITGRAVRPSGGLVGPVVTNDEAVAEVPFSPEIQRLSRTDLHRLVMQLAWTLSQVPGITRLRLTADGVPVAISGGRSDISLVGHLDYDPVSAPSSDVVAISGGKLVTVASDGSVRPVAGPLGGVGYSMRSVAHSITEHQYAAVSGNGARLFEASDYIGGATGTVRTVLSGASNLLRPVYDRFGDLWVLDATRSGAVVHLISGGHDRVVRVDGISGRRISSFTVTRDGARLVAGASSPQTSVVVSGILRADRGRVVRVLRAETLDTDGLEAGPVLDVGQDSGTTIAVLTRTPSGTRRILPVQLDGAPGFGRSTPDAIPQQLISLLVTPDPALGPQAVSADHELLVPNALGQWVRLAGDILTAAYPD
ncbi:MAG: LpqB family beta-propeller domain-containing protein [Marmoricola sp.]